MAAGFADACWDESNASDSDTPSDEENQVLLFFIRMLMKSILQYVSLDFSFVDVNPHASVHKDVHAKQKVAIVPHVASANRRRGHVKIGPRGQKQ